MKKIILFLIFCNLIIPEKLFYDNGKVKYDGKLKFGLPYGKGKFFDVNEKLVYEGNFKKGLPNGNGIL